jgi:hypothetical protein
VGICNFGAGMINNAEAKRSFCVQTDSQNKTLYRLFLNQLLTIVFERVIEHQATFTGRPTAVQNVP